MPKVVENIQLGLSACRIGLRKCWQWMRCHRPLVVVRDQYEVLCLGLNGAGKSTALATLVGENIDNIEPTTGFNIKTLPLKETVLDIKELGGADNVRPFWNRYFTGQHGLLYVVNSASSDDDLKLSLESLLIVLSDPAMKGIPCVVLATHVDCSDSRTQHNLEQFFQSALHGRKWTIQMCSLQDNESIQNALETLIDLMAYNV